MRSPLTLLVTLAFGSLASSCAAGAALNQSNGAKMGEALAFAAAAGAAQVAQSVAEQRARYDSAVTHSSTGVSVTPQCDNDGQYSCVTATVVAPAAEPASDVEMTDGDARDYVVGYLNGVRKLNAQGPIARDESLDAFAQVGTDELSEDHTPNHHIVEHRAELPAGSFELQSAPDGLPAGSLQDRIGEVLLRWTGEGPGGMHHDAMLRPGWRRVGVGIARRDGRTYFTVDLAP